MSSLVIPYYVKAQMTFNYLQKLDEAFPIKFLYW